MRSRRGCACILFSGFEEMGADVLPFFLRSKRVKVIQGLMSSHTRLAKRAPVNIQVYWHTIRAGTCE